MKLGGVKAGEMLQESVEQAGQLLASAEMVARRAAESVVIINPAIKDWMKLHSEPTNVGNSALFARERLEAEP